MEGIGKILLHALTLKLNLTGKVDGQQFRVFLFNMGWYENAIEKKSCMNVRIQRLQNLSYFFTNKRSAAIDLFLIFSGLMLT